MSMTENRQTWDAALKRERHVAIIGGGLVGSLQACFLAKRGFRVDLYEAREDIRTAEHVHGRSVNLGLSRRGREALQHVGLEEEVVRSGIPMYGRRVHSLSGKTSAQAYGKKGQCVVSLSRRLLNETLLTAAEGYPNVTTHFRHKLVRTDLDEGTVVIRDESGQEFTVHPDLIVGCDGIHSTLREHLMDYGRIDYSQDYISHGYMELPIPAKNGKFAIDENCLHVWPRGRFMMIATPNPDASFSCSLFLPFECYEDLWSGGDAACLAFFREHFPDAVPLIGEKELQETFKRHRAYAMKSIKCSPHHYKEKAVIMGDAAHAMVPFYGQGMNSGFEDCIVFNEALDKFDNDFGKALSAYSELRTPDAKALCDLNLHNFLELRSLVASRWFLFRKRLDWFLHWLMPARFIPLYTMVTFSRIRYHEVIRRWKLQNSIVNGALFGLAWIHIIIAGTIILRRSYFKQN